MVKAQACKPGGSLTARGGAPVLGDITNTNVGAGRFPSAKRANCGPCDRPPGLLPAKPADPPYLASYSALTTQTLHSATISAAVQAPGLLFGGSSSCLADCQGRRQCFSDASTSATTGVGASASAMPTPRDLVFAPASSSSGTVIMQSSRSVSMDDGLDSLLCPEDPQNVSEYASEIYDVLGAQQQAFLVNPNYIDSHPDINAKMRAILIDWLLEVHLKYKLKTETLFLAVNIVDRYLEKRSVARKKLQLVGVTGMLIAAKFEEIYPPEIKDFVYITDKAYTKEEIISMETTMLSTLGFVICAPTAGHFCERYRLANRCQEKHGHLLQYLLELSLPDIRMLRHPPSLIAAAATLLSNKLLKQHPSWPTTMVRYTKHTEQMVRGCAKELCGLLEAAECSPLQAARKKYSQPRYSKVALMTF